LKLVVALLLFAFVAEANAQTVPSVMQLFGPVQSRGALLGPAGSSWVFPGSALSASTKMFPFNLAIHPVVFARWVFVWIPRSSTAKARLVAFDYCKSQGNCINLEVLAEIDGMANNSPVVNVVLITSQLNNLIGRGELKHIGFQMMDNGAAQWMLFESRLEMSFLLP
jgi:hypothetical protein